MHIHLQCADDQALARLSTTQEAVCEVVKQIVGESGERLVLLIRLVDDPGWSAECFYSVFTPEDLHEEERPGALPSQCRLMRMTIGEHTYPLTTIDDYAWTWYFETFLDHLAVVV